MNKSFTKFLALCSLVAGFGNFGHVFADPTTDSSTADTTQATTQSTTGTASAPGASDSTSTASTTQKPKPPMYCPTCQATASAVDVSKLPALSWDEKTVGFSEFCTVHRCATIDPSDTTKARRCRKNLNHAGAGAGSATVPSTCEFRPPKREGHGEESKGKEREEGDEDKKGEGRDDKDDRDEQHRGGHKEGREEGEDDQQDRGQMRGQQGMSDDGDGQGQGQRRERRGFRRPKDGSRGAGSQGDIGGDQMMAGPMMMGQGMPGSDQGEPAQGGLWQQGGGMQQMGGQQY